jgi:predicted ATPase with chaperone activity
MHRFDPTNYDLPIALGIMAAIGAIPPNSLSNCTVLGELALDRPITAVADVLPAAIAANARGETISIFRAMAGIDTISVTTHVYRDKNKLIYNQ